MENAAAIVGAAAAADDDDDDKVLNKHAPTPTKDRCRYSSGELACVKRDALLAVETYCHSRGQ
ncbi:hypothetical protein T4B_4571 [Trichinella pseudospiralis]|uniref:Uncharacterized protein n=1 Tax=Trichinella pseudospiralis TaxID=6337 RepID=A0A0V1DXE8_TRIPS|nr:hypothetical protein T4A_13298 [Trichinella pseudospiralis]KRZ20802.1 hypothetical protein T4B_4571 [Trichinella pseudospiralis]